MLNAGLMRYSLLPPVGKHGAPRLEKWVCFTVPTI